MTEEDFSFDVTAPFKSYYLYCLVLNTPKRTTICLCVGIYSAFFALHRLGQYRPFWAVLWVCTLLLVLVMLVIFFLLVLSAMKSACSLPSTPACLGIQSTKSVLPKLFNLYLELFMGSVLWCLISYLTWHLFIMSLCSVLQENKIRMQPPGALCSWFVFAQYNSCSCT